MKHAFRLAYGLEYRGQTYFDAVLKPLTIGAELAAMAEEEGLPELPENAAPAQTARVNVLKNLMMFARQLEVAGVPPEIMTADYLMEHLSGEDYLKLHEEQEALRSKSSAAGDGRATAAAHTADATGAVSTKTSAKPSSS